MNAAKVFSVAHFFCGLGSGARGFARAQVRYQDATAKFRTLGGIDVDPDACRDFEMLTGSPALCADMHEVTPAQIRAVLGDETPDCVFTSPPCKGFSGLLGNDAAQAEKYQRLNQLVFKGLHLMCETWSAPPPLIVLENVPRITSRGAALLEKARGLLRSYGYLFHESTHDCGEIGGLAQHRRRFLLVARLPSAVSNFVYKPPVKRVRGCGEVLGPMPMPHLEEGGALHRLPNIELLTWVRLAMIPAGGDWRDLPRKDDPGELARLLALKSDSRPNLFGVTDWEDPTKSVTGSASVTGSNGVAAVADPRLAQAVGLPDRPARHKHSMRMTGWDEPSGTVTSSPSPSSGAIAVADPRWGGGLGLTGWAEPAGTVCGRSLPHNGRFSVADPRLAEAVAMTDKPNRHQNKYGVAGWDEPAPAVIGSTRPNSGAGSVVDPRIAAELTSPLVKGQAKREAWQRYDLRRWKEAARAVTGDGANGAWGVVDSRDLSPGVFKKGPYGVMSWSEAAATVIGSAQVDNGPVSVSDPRDPPAEVPVIASPHDGFWHRPMTTLELAALQGLPWRLNAKPLQLAGRSSSSWRERIGNAVPEGAACAIGESMLMALLCSKLGTWTLGGTGIWVQSEEGNDEEVALVAI